MKKTSYYIINAITFYRLVSAFLLLYLIYSDNLPIFKWLLAFSFFTDSIDGFLARKYKVTSAAGSKVDSIADDLTILVAIIGLIVFKADFIQKQLILLIFLFSLFVVQTMMAIVKYGKISSFHTYLAKIAAVFQGSFFILAFFLPEPPLVLFYIAAALTFLDLIEEIILVIVLPDWKTDVKGLLWLKRKGDAKE